MPQAAIATHSWKSIHVTAMTGCAAILLNCKATTLHSWAGIGLGNGTIETLVNKIKKNSFARALWRNTHILVVDEVSMLSFKLFNILNTIGKVLRKNPAPFGGIQLIFSEIFVNCLLLVKMRSQKHNNSVLKVTSGKMYLVSLVRFN